uniref:LAGLIDADG endonuclease n=1 Tax=Ganoderma calidophilum TaxID=2026244 RepID=A0A2S1WBX0_9APHY|nr:LAGLIDADG endonuclease [Ganoderma calidophilum]AWJ64012.1 LAGLIDADG endonuclease [Ganoderma calidophilum]
MTGFTDAEGCFIILILKDPKNNKKTNWTVKTRFSIGLHKKDTLILELIKSHFGGIGTISLQNKESVQYRVGSLKDLNDKIIPHFDKYPLISKKKKQSGLYLKNNKLN